jgi:hypothetical protein
MPSINLIFARSPYQVIINEANQVKTKIEIKLWNKGDTPPANPTYIMSEGIASVTQTETNYNIAPFILEFIDKFYLEYLTSTITEANKKEWCIGEYKTYYSTDGVTYTLKATVSFCAVNGYSIAENGVNHSLTKTKAYLLLANPNIKVYWNTIIPYYNFICKDSGNDYIAKWIDKTETILKTETFYTGVNDFFNYAIPLVFETSVSLEIFSKSGEKIYKINTEEICEPKYPVQTTWFVNKLGGWNQFNFFKASYNSIEVKNSDYSLMQKEVDYDYRRGQTKPFNINGNESIKVNSGWVTEDYFEWIQDMMLSDTILLNPQTPVTIKTTSMQKKTILKDKNINYTLEFDFANKLINNII